MIFEVQHGAGISQAASGLNAVAQTALQLEDRERAIAQQEQEHELALQSAALTADRQRELTAYRQQQGELASQGLQQRQQQFEAELYSDPTVAQGMAYLDELGEADTINGLQPGSAPWWREVHRAAEEGALRRQEMKLGRAISSVAALEQAGKLPEGSAQEYQARLQSGEDPDDISADIFEKTRKTSERDAKVASLTALAQRYARAAESPDFLDDAAPGAGRKVKELAAQIEALAQIDPDHELIHGYEDPLTGERKPGLLQQMLEAKSPLEVQERLAAQEQEIQVLRAQAAGIAGTAALGVAGLTGALAGAGEPDRPRGMIEERPGDVGGGVGGHIQFAEDQGDPAMQSPGQRQDPELRALENDEGGKSLLGMIRANKELFEDVAGAAENGASMADIEAMLESQGVMLTEKLEAALNKFLEDRERAASKPKASADLTLDDKIKAHRRRYGRNPDRVE